MTRVPRWVPVLAIVALVAVGVGVDRLDPSTATARPEPVPAGAAVSGAWYCAAGDTAESAEMRVIAAAPPNDAGTPAEVTIDSFSAGVTARSLDTHVNPGSSARRDLPSGLGEVGIAARWWEAPAAVTRSAFVRPAGGPEGYLEGPCVPEPSPTWIVPGVATAGGAQAVLVLANPFDTDASVAVTFTTPEGPIEPKLLENVVVPKRSTRSVLLNEHAPERPDLGVVVTTRAGRVVAEGVQTLSAAIGGVDGVSLVPAAARPAENWTVPWLEVGGEDTQSWLWVSNVADRPAALALTLHTPTGGVVPDTLDELTVAPGETRRVDLRGLLPEGTTRSGVTVRSENSVPITVSAATRFAGPDPARTGFAVRLGATDPDRLWVLTGGPTRGRDTRLSLVNPGSERAVIDVLVWSADGAVRPRELQGVTVAPGSLRIVDVTGFLPAEADDHTLFVTAREGSVVAGRQAEDRTGTRRLVATLGVPGALWAGGEIVPPVEFAPALTQRLGTVLGPRPDDPLEIGEEPTEAPSPASSPPGGSPSDEPGTGEPATDEPATDGPTGTAPPAG